MADMRRSDVELYRGLEQSLGPDVATALMERLPQEPPSNLATKDDLRTGLHDLEQRLDARFQALDGCFDLMDEHIERSKLEVLATIRGEIGGAIQSQTRIMAFTLVGALAGIVGVAAVI